MQSRNSLLWSVKSGTSDKVKGYIFGTMHLGTPAAYTYSGLAEKYISQSDIYLSETDIDGLNAQQQSVFCLPDGLHLRQLLTQHKYDKYREKILRFTGSDLDHIGHFLPFYLQSVLATIMLEVQYVSPLDAYLWQYAKNSGLPCRGIEDIEEQKEILKNIPLPLQMKSFRDMCDHMSSWRSKLIYMQKIYAAADLKQLYKIARQQSGGLRRLLLFERNNIISQRMNDLLHQEDVIFVSLGAAHLWGNEGILAHLKRKELTVKPIFG